MKRGRHLEIGLEPIRRDNQFDLGINWNKCVIFESECERSVRVNPLSTLCHRPSHGHFYNSVICQPV